MIPYLCSNRALSNCDQLVCNACQEITRPIEPEGGNSPYELFKLSNLIKASRYKAKGRGSGSNVGLVIKIERVIQG